MEKKYHYDDLYSKLYSVFDAGLACLVHRRKVKVISRRCQGIGYNYTVHDLFRIDKSDLLKLGPGDVTFIVGNYSMPNLLISFCRVV